MKQNKMKQNKMKQNKMKQNKMKPVTKQLQHKETDEVFAITPDIVMIDLGNKELPSETFQINMVYMGSDPTDPYIITIDLGNKELPSETII